MEVTRPCQSRLFPYRPSQFHQDQSRLEEAPEASATLIVQLPALEGGPTLRLTGPGIRADATIAPMGLPPDFVAQWSRNRALFPAGVDLVLCAGDRLAAFPRTLSIAEV